ncbi:calcium-translocating P-type ATPase [Clostridium bornimense]|uniref:P-type Ca(2+) transporter n=1 Tax=Clostridium bornimense TaxID=1216932 RepID=W6RVJ6_9CLOT|nr:cation-translocating P-type ATPase [Clostridium bornimense]CDM68353.1 calcium-translocating P-type ATPase [Clostridium bornimense]
MFYNKSKKEVLQTLNSNEKLGLTTKESTERLAKNGKNILESSEKKSMIKAFFNQFKDFMIYILIIAAIISGFLGEITDAAIIILVILLNAVIGVIQEAKAEHSLEALKQLSTPKALVKRDGTLSEISSEDIVIGDIVILDAGRYVPCDIRLLEDVNLKIDESALTGESEPVTKDSSLALDNENVPLGDRRNMAFMSTLVTYGRGVGIATSTGMNTEIGHIAEMIKENTDSTTPLQKKLAELGKFLGFAAIGICILIFIIGLFQKRPFLEIFMTSISLAVAAIPEGLPAIVTIVLALGVTKMSKENAIVKKLPAVETLGSVNIICSDKTGTLTQNKMTVTKFYCNEIYDTADKLDINDTVSKLLLEGNILCNDATFTDDTKTGDPTEIALLEIGYKYNIIKDELSILHPRVEEIPFDSDRKLMTTVNKYNDVYYSFTKGAIDNLLKICNKVLIKNTEVDLTDNLKETILNKATSMSSDALRVLGLAFKKIKSSNMTISTLESDLIFIGMVGMIDPPRTEVKDSINTATLAGIKTIMITGDHKDTAFAIGKDLGIADSINEAISGSELDKISDSELNKNIDNYRIFARVSPEHKVKIVKAFKSNGNIVSMTGDGVNDAPSLKAADIGVAMGITGTDVSKGAADIILLDDNFSTIVEAVKKGRSIFKNIKKSIIFLISCNLGEIVTILISILFNLPTPLRPIHLLWVNLITDSLPALSLGIDEEETDIMNEPPRNPNDSLFTGSITNLILNGILIGLLSISAFILGGAIHSNEIAYSLQHFDISGVILGFNHLNNTGNIYYPQTMAFIVLSVSQLVHSLNLRSDKKSIFQVGIFSNKYLILSIILGIVIQDIVTMVPFLASIFKVINLTSKDWLLVITLSITPLILNEIVKIFKRNKKRMR